MELEGRVPRRLPARRAAPAVLALMLVASGLAGAVADRPAAAPPGEPAYPHGRFTGDCAECHGDQGWKPARISRRFNHAKRSGFPLTGAHSSVSCVACHASLDFTAEQQRKQCAACHQDPHLGEFGGDCGRCHTARSFLDRAAMVSMHQMTRFPLVGAHGAIECESCHPPTAQGHLRFVGTAAACRACHTPGAVPDHRNFSSDCTRCHSMMTWSPARFDHGASGFPLTCPHLPPVTCVQCHGDPWTASPPTDCYACHRAAYDGTAAPNHAAAGFSTRCVTCHDVSRCGWTFDHGAFFPIVSGRHAGIACTTCHDVPTDYASFNCLTGGCHTSANTTPRHSGVGGYQYVSSACYRCHPSGQAGN